MAAFVGAGVAAVGDGVGFGVGAGVLAVGGGVASGRVGALVVGTGVGFFVVGAGVGFLVVVVLVVAGALVVSVEVVEGGFVSGTVGALLGSNEVGATVGLALLPSVAKLLLLDAVDESPLLLSNPRPNMTPTIHITTTNKLNNTKRVFLSPFFLIFW